MTIPTSSTTLHPPWVHVARAAWIVMALACVGLFVATTINTANAPLPSCTTPKANCLPASLSHEDMQVVEQMRLPIPFFAFMLGISIVARISLVLVAVIIFWRRSNDWVAMMLAASLLTALIEGGFGTMDVVNIIVDVLYTIGGTLFFALPFVFPNGRCEPRWLRPFVPPLIGVYALTTFILPFAPETAWMNAAITIAWTIASIYAMAYRYVRVSNAVERQQTKWVLLGLLATFVVGIDYVLMGVFFPISQPTEGRILALLINGGLYLAGYGFFAFSFGVAMLRYRLWDIDILIRRTLVYSSLSALLALTYFGLVIVTQNIFRALTGGESQLAVVVSTLAIAALFFPLRSRVQTFIDRRFYRQKYDAAKTLAEFAATARDEVELDKLAERLVEVVEETMQPQSLTFLFSNQESRNAPRNDSETPIA